VSAPTITVAIVKRTRPPWWPGRRWQPYRWVARAENHRKVAVSGESYTNRADCVRAIVALFASIGQIDVLNEHGDLTITIDIKRGVPR